MILFSSKLLSAVRYGSWFIFFQLFLFWIKGIWNKFKHTSIFHYLGNNNYSVQLLAGGCAKPFDHPMPKSLYCIILLYFQLFKRVNPGRLRLFDLTVLPINSWMWIKQNFTKMGVCKRYSDSNFIPIISKNKYISQITSHYNYFSQIVITFHVSLQYLFFTKYDE